MTRNKINRRHFLKVTAGIAGASALPSFSAPAKKTAFDRAPLGKTGLRLSRLGLGCGTHGGYDQRNMGTKGFNRLVHYAYERGINFIDTADSYKTHPFVRDAIKSLPREKLFLLTKMGGLPENPLKELNRFRKELGTDYIDCLLIHCKVHANWDETHKRLIDALTEAKEKGIIRSHGVSCHSFPATAKAAQLDWVDVNLVRVNPQGLHLDTPVESWSASSDASHVQPVIEQLAIMRQKGHGIIGMKILGEGDLTDPRERKKSIRFAMQPGLVDAVTIGFKSIAELDEAITNINEALAVS